MDANEANAVKQDFRVWSGGSPPDSEQEIFLYVEYARPNDTDAIEVSRMLTEWMEEEWRSASL